MFSAIAESYFPAIVPGSSSVQNPFPTNFQVAPLQTEGDIDGDLDGDKDGVEGNLDGDLEGEFEGDSVH